MSKNQNILLNSSLNCEMNKSLLFVCLESLVPISFPQTNLKLKTATTSNDRELRRVPIARESRLPSRSSCKTSPGVEHSSKTTFRDSWKMCRCCNCCCCCCLFEMSFQAKCPTSRDRSSGGSKFRFHFWKNFHRLANQCSTFSNLI